MDPTSLRLRKICFRSPEIENNLKVVDDTIRDFYGWEKYESKEEEQE